MRFTKKAHGIYIEEQYPIGPGIPIREKKCTRFIQYKSNWAVFTFIFVSTDFGQAATAIIYGR